jgi:pyruvate formate lyase activating enzyme
MQLPAMILDYNFKDSGGYIFDIQGMSVHDGPGCRTLIFLSGCTMNCLWCSNPEGISMKPSLMYFSSKCILCGRCIENCQHHALTFDNGSLKFSRQLCEVCEDQSCNNECYTGALRFSGYMISVSKLYDIIRRDRQFWGSEGGITLTGGEPLLQADFARDILLKCHESYIHTAVETCGNISWKNFMDVIPFLDWIFFDLKHQNNSLHKKVTGTGNKLILENAKRLSEEFEGRMIFRLPVITGYNDSEENINSVISFIKETGRNEINILPMHNLGKEKYQLLGKIYYGSNYPVPSSEKMEKIAELFRASDIKCFTGSQTPF